MDLSTYSEKQAAQQISGKLELAVNLSLLKELDAINTEVSFVKGPSTLILVIDLQYPISFPLSRSAPVNVVIMTIFINGGNSSLNDDSSRRNFLSNPVQHQSPLFLLVPWILFANNPQNSAPSTKEAVFASFLQRRLYSISSGT